MYQTQIGEGVVEIELPQNSLEPAPRRALYEKETSERLTSTTREIAQPLELLL
jgi:hypothetical protein